MIKVNSSNIKAVEYLAEEKVLRVLFKNEVLYSYKDVAVEVFENLLKAESVGKFFNDNVKTKYFFSKEEKKGNNEA